MADERQRSFDRAENEMRPVTLTREVLKHAAGSCMAEFGDTRVLCAATIEEGVPRWRKGSRAGWVTAEYAMLPASTGRRTPREYRGRKGRSMEIERLIGRSLRTVVDMHALGEVTVTVDCDVIQADGGTRTASITGAFTALCIAVDRLMQEGVLKDSPIIRQVAAVSAGVIDNECTLDLEYAQDSRAQVDMNIVMTRDAKGALGFVEVQGTGEGRCYTRAELDRLLALGEKGCLELMEAQREALGARAEVICKKPLLVLASNNFGKLRELKAMLGERFDVRSMREMGIELDVEETGETFEENALLKANALMALCHCATLADDSGLCVDQLDGRPGVHSARYCGVHGDDEANNRLLLQELADKPAPHAAHYGAAIALCRPGRAPLMAYGRCDGQIIGEYRGTGGFGYEPLFLSDDLVVTFAEADPEAKNGVSHRARGIRKILELLEAEDA